jgi:hypothetical protein
MSLPPFNVLTGVVVPCPRCGQRSPSEVRLLFGHRNGRRYRLGARVDWPEAASESPGGRPPEGNLDSQGFAACAVCGHEFSLTVHVRSDILVAVEPNVDRRLFLED